MNKLVAFVDRHGIMHFGSRYAQLQVPLWAMLMLLLILAMMPI